MAVRVHSRATLWAWALVFLAAVCKLASAGGGVGGGGCSSPCPTIPYGHLKDKTCCTCTYDCDNGAEGKAMCTAGSWNVTVSCPQVTTGCKQSDLSYPYVSSWSCKDSNTCYAYCKDGYKGVVKAICSGGAWHYYGECKLVPPCPKYCWYQPPSVAGIFWPYTCYGAEYVKANCGPGYQPGYVEAKCTCGKWVIYGQCKKIEVPRCDHYCWSMPPNVPGINWPNSCYGSQGYTAQCQSGYFAGTVKATCKCGKWEVTGSCTKIPQPRCDKYCYGLPPPVTGIYWPNNCWGASIFKATCMSGYTGYVEAKCECGKWVTYGDCQKIQTPPPCPTTCADKPGHVDGIYWPNSCKGTSYYKASCKPGYVSGYVEAKCECGKWVTYGTCPKITISRRCRGTPKRKHGAKSWSYRKCHKKYSCSVKCKWGYRGKGYKARCYRGKWKVSGSCHRKRYFFF